MSTLKDHILHDIEAAFINTKEFAEEHILDDQTVVCIVQDVNIAEDLTVDKKGEYFPDLFGDAKTINISKNQLEEIPVYGQLIYLDGERYEVVSVADDMGLLTIVITGNKR